MSLESAPLNFFEPSVNTNIGNKLIQYAEAWLSLKTGS